MDTGTVISEQLQVEATAAAGAYLQILDPDQTMTPAEVDAFSVGVQAGITAALVIRAGDIGDGQREGECEPLTLPSVPEPVRVPATVPAEPAREPAEVPA